MYGQPPTTTGGGASLALARRVPAAANIKLLHLTDQRLAHLKPVRVLDIFDGITGDFHEEGLFSTSIFGRIGSDERDTRFSYIDIRTEIFHPFIHKTLCTLKGMYKNLMAGKAYAIWDDAAKDFQPSDMVNGQSGFHFFMQHWKDINFKRTGSHIRDARIELIEKAKKEGTATTTKIMVLPAGLRDYQIDATGRHKQGEINDFYRAVINASNAISTTSDLDTPIINTTRNSLQNNFNLIFEYLKSLIDEKGGFIQSKWGRRHIAYGSRNVITSMDTSTANLNAPNAPDINSTMIGLYQLAKAASPLTKHLLATGWLSQVFNGPEGKAYLVNPSTLRREIVSISPKTIDRWTTTSGLEDVISLYAEHARRNQPVTIEDYYVGLIYKGPDSTFKIFGDIDELPRELDAKLVTPLTLCELIYLSGYKEWNKIPLSLTRYPVSGAGSIYMSYSYMKPTTKTEMRWELDDVWNKQEDDEHRALDFPIINEDSTYFDSLAPHPSRLAAAGGDFDGDMMSANSLLSDEARAEVEAYLNSRRAYVTPSGGLINSSSTVDTIERVLFNMTGEPID